MTTSDSIASLNEPKHLAFRLTILLFAILLGVQSIWLLLAEFSRAETIELPTNATAAATAAKERDTALMAASMGAIRGDLWAQSAFTYADLLFDQTGAINNLTLASAAEAAQRSIVHALALSPHPSSVWLLLAGLTQRFPLSGIDPLEVLKMSYYTGPSEENLMPLRLRIAVRADRFDDIQIREFASREIRVLLNAKQNSAIAEAYNVGSPAAKRFVEGAVGDLDATFAKTLRASGAQKQSFPN